MLQNDRHRSDALSEALREVAVEMRKESIQVVLDDREITDWMRVAEHVAVRVAPRHGLRPDELAAGYKAMCDARAA